MLFRRLAWWVAFGFIIAMVIFTLRRVELESLLSAMRLLSWTHLLVLLAVQALTMSLIALQWQKTLQIHGHYVPFYTLLKMNLMGAFFEGLTPAAKSGGEVLRYKILTDLKLSKRTVMQVMVFQKGLSLMVFVMFLVFSLLVFVPRLENTPTFPLGGIVLFFSGLVAILMAGYLFLLKTKESTSRAILKQAWMTHRHHRLPLLLFSVLVWLIYPLKLLLLVWMMQASLTFDGAFITTYIAYAVAQIPLTLGGVGTFEATFVTIIQWFSFSETVALSTALWFRFVTFWSVFFVGATFLLIQLIKSIRSLR